MKKFKLKPGQIDFSKARWAPVINCVLEHQGKILAVQRSKEMDFYPEHWNGIAGFLDDHRSLEQKVRDELKEELGISSRNIISIKLGKIFDQEAPKYKKTWIVHPVLVKVATDKVYLDWEAQNYQWLKISAVKKLKLLPGFEKVLEAIKNL